MDTSEDGQYFLRGGKLEDHSDYCDSCRLIGGYCGNCSGAFWELVAVQDEAAKIQRTRRVNIPSKCPKCNEGHIEGSGDWNVDELHAAQSKPWCNTCGVAYDPATREFSGGW